MTEPIDLAGRGALSAPGSIQGLGKPSGIKPPTDGHGPAFEVLLERLQAQARELEHTSRAVERPADLAEAVGRAHDSLEAALSFGDRLLEAYRQRLHRSADVKTDPSVAPAESAGPAGKPR